TSLPPPFFRAIEEPQPPLLIDEADTFLQGNDELRGILNSGYTRKTAYVVRVTAAQRSPQAPPGATRETTSGNPSSTRLARFPCWCPKAISAIGRLPDTLADRCIVIRMRRKVTSEQCERLKHLQADPLRRRCARFVADHAAAIAAAGPNLTTSPNATAW